MPLAAGIARVERLVASFERGLIVVLLAVMAGSVFLDALHRIFAAEEGRSARLLMALLPAAWHEGARTVLAPVVLLAATFGIVVAALTARQRNGGVEAASRGSRWLRAAMITAGLALATRLLIWALPNGLVFSQQMSLCFMLWIALAGASLGAREHAHIAFELAGQIWPASLRRPAERLARVLAAGFSLFLAVLAAAHTQEHYFEWQSSDGAAGLFEAFPVPRFLIYGFLPFPFSVMGLRFLLFGVRADAPHPPLAGAPPAAPEATTR
jgi:TRAP-type C4-dicarboxylate transport system permease small subunit